MLHLITGRAGTGKSFYIRQEIHKRAQQGLHSILLVPEQFSFETEKSFYTADQDDQPDELYYILGPKLLQYADILSFKRLSHEIFKQYGGLAGRYADDVSRSVLMSLAVEEIQDALQFYRKSISDFGFIRLMLDAVSELKNAGISPEGFAESISHVSNIQEGFEKKLADISLLYTTYNAMLERTYRDPLDDLMRALEKVRGTEFFHGKAVFLDEFKGFTAAQYQMTREILENADEVYISLCMEPGNDRLFETVRDTASAWKQMARELNIPVAAPVHLTQPYRYHSAALVHLEQHVLRSRRPSWDQTQNTVRTMESPGIYEEIDRVLSEIRRLVREDGYRYRDMVLLARRIEPYQNLLEAAFVRYDIPFFMDLREGIDTQPLIRFVILLLQAAGSHYDLDSMLGMLKSGVTRYTIQEIADFENYLYIWNLSGSQLSIPFTANPNGFSSRFSEQEKIRLADLNRLRAPLYTAVDSLRSLGAKAPAEAIHAQIRSALSLLGAEERLLRLNQEADGTDPEQVRAINEENRLWDILEDILLQIQQAAGSAPLTLTRFQSLFLVGLQNYDMGKIPHTLDAVTVGLGVNEGSFPEIPTEQGIFTDAQRRTLQDMGISLAADTTHRILEERFIAYHKLCCSSERLYLSRYTADLSGAPLLPSEVFSSVENLFPDAPLPFKDSLELCQNEASAFSALAHNFKENTPQIAALRSYFSDKPERRLQLERLSAAINKTPFQISSRDVAVRLFGRDMRLSPTRVEKFYRCPFSYFCETGLKARARKRAELNPLETGSLLHHVLYTVTRDFQAFMDLNDKEIRQTVQNVLAAYLEEVMSGADTKDQRFLYLYNRTRTTLVKLLSRLQSEFQHTEFIPSDFELSIQSYTENKNSQVFPLSVETKNGSVQLSGTIDRVDLLEKNGYKYVRVVDYKSGQGKDFRLSDVYYGLNLQMLFYLFALWETGRDPHAGVYKNVLPAGILYMPAVAPEPSLGRDASPEDTEKILLGEYRANGLLLQDDAVLDAMEQVISGQKGIFIPVGRKKDGSFSVSTLESLVSLEEMGQLMAYAEKLLAQMHDRLLDGKISAVPAENSGFSPCTYCDYRAVCGHEPTDEVLSVAKLDRQTLLRQIKEEMEG